MTISHQAMMQRALELAERGRLSVSPNPMVGCVLVKEGRIVGEGYHQQAGHPHAEVLALREARENARGATAYVSLEPCCHHGKTPPCTQALIHAGVTEVYAACFDPNPSVSGKGIEELTQAGIKVHVGLCQHEAEALNEIFFHYMRFRRPFVIAKWAMSLDGKTMTHAEDSRHISNDASRRCSHLIRHQVDAILIGSKTAIHDDPQLNVRLEGDLQPRRQPLRIVLASHGDLPMHLKLTNGTLPGKTLIVTTQEKTIKPNQISNIEFLCLPKDQHDQVHLPSLLDELGKRGITSLLVEGGMTVHASFFHEKCVNKIHVHLAPVIIGSLKQKQTINIQQVANIDNDFHLISTYLETRHV